MNHRYKTTRNVSIVNATTNSLLAIFKIVVGIIGNSHALIADGIHSFSDLISDALVLLAAKFGNRHPDAKHPYGHQRIETIAAIIIAFILLIVGAGIVYDTIIYLIAKETEHIKGVAVIVVAIISVAANEWLYHYTKNAGKRIHSNLLLTNAWHNRGDALVSVIVLVSVIGTLLGVHYLDAIGAIVIAGFILKIAINMIWHSISELIDAAADEKTIQNIRHLIQNTDGVRSIHQLRTRLHGGNIFVDVHIIVDPKISVSEGHFISDQVAMALCKGISTVSDVTVHIDPEDDERVRPSSNLPNRQDLEYKLEKCWQTLPGFKNKHKILLHYLDGHIHIELYLSTQLLKTRKADEINSQYQQAIKGIPDITQLIIHYSDGNTTRKDTGFP